MDSFEYTYSAKKQDEIEKIRNKYIKKEPDTLEKLRKVDRDADRPAVISSIFVGIVGTLIFGFGMSCCLLWIDTMFVIGLASSLIGLSIMALALPIYKIVVKKQREKFAPLILELSKEIMK